MSKFIVDFSKFKEANARHAVLCNHCNKQLGEHYPNAKGCIAVTLPKHYKGEEETDASEDVIYAEKEPNFSETKHFCNEDHMFQHLKDRKDKFEANRAKEMNQ